MYEAEERILDFNLELAKYKAKGGNILYGCIFYNQKVVEDIEYIEVS